jgi:hypothetical protein
MQSLSVLAVDAYKLLQTSMAWTHRAKVLRTAVEGVFVFVPGISREIRWWIGRFSQPLLVDSVELLEAVGR